MDRKLDFCNTNNTSSLYIWKLGTSVQSINMLLYHNYILHSCRVWPHLIWLVILLILWRVYEHSMWSLLFPGTYSHTWVFPSIRIVFSVTFIPGLFVHWTNDFRLRNNGRLLPSLYFVVYASWNKCQNSILEMSN